MSLHLFFFFHLPDESEMKWFYPWVFIRLQLLCPCLPVFKDELDILTLHIERLFEWKRDMSRVSKLNLEFGCKVLDLLLLLSLLFKLDLVVINLVLIEQLFRPRGFLFVRYVLLHITINVTEFGFIELVRVLPNLISDVSNIGFCGP